MLHGMCSESPRNVFSTECVPDRHVSIAESQPALKVSFNRPRPRSQPAAGRVCWLFIFFHGSQDSCNKCFWKRQSLGSAVSPEP
jgi:hypothetical protein